MRECIHCGYNADGICTAPIPIVLERSIGAPILDGAWTWAVDLTKVNANECAFFHTERTPPLPSQPRGHYDNEA